MPITKSLAKKAHRMVVALEEQDGLGVAYWEPYKLTIWGINPAEALEQMAAAQELLGRVPDAKFHHSPDNKRLVNAEYGGDWLSDAYRTPHELLTEYREEQVFGHAFDPSAEEELPGIETIAPDETPTIMNIEVERIGGVPVSGAIAYKEGIASADCPYDSEEQYDEFERWNREWDEAADLHEEEEEKPSGSVVKDKYRAIYAERGHPAHCGDWLAEILNNLCIANGQTDIGRFKAIMDANGIDMSKYKTTGNGWQGRYRMTGRNLLARRLFSAEFLLAPDMNGDIQSYPVPQEWKNAQTFVREAPRVQEAQATA
jgi:hypothetical protein